MTFEAADEELSKEKIAIVLQEVFARGKDAHIAYAGVQEGQRVFGKEVEELKKKDRVEMTDQREKAYVFACKESDEGVFVKKESKQSAKDVEVNHIEKDVEGVAYVFARKESKELIEDDFVKGWEDAKNSVKGEEEDFHVFACKESKKETGRVRAADHVEIEQLIKKIITEAVEVKQLTDEESFVEAKNMFRSLERSLANLEKIDEKIFMESEGVKEEDFLEALRKLVRGIDILLHAPHGDKDKLRKGQVRAARENVWRALKSCRVYCKMLEDCSTVGVRAGNNVHSEDGEAVKSDVVREAPGEEVLEVEDMIERFKKRYETVEAKVVNVDVDKEFGNVIVDKRLGMADEEKLDEEYVKTIEDKSVKTEKPSRDKGKGFAGKYAKSKYDKVKIDETGVEFVKAADVQNAENATDNREKDKAGVGVHQVRKCGTDDVQSVSPVSESSVQIVERVRVGVFAAESKVFKSAVGAGPMYRQKHRDNGHVYSQSYEVNGGKGVGDLKQLWGLDVVERNSPWEPLFADMSQVEEPDGPVLAMDPKYIEKCRVVKPDTSTVGVQDRASTSPTSSLVSRKYKYTVCPPPITKKFKLFVDVSIVEEPDALRLVMDRVYTKKYEAVKHMCRQKYRVDSGQGIKVLKQSVKLDTAEQDGPSQPSFSGGSWVEEPSRLGQLDMQLARTVYDENQAGTVQEESRDSEKSFPKWGCSDEVDCFVC